MRETSVEFAARAGLVRVVAQDGSVWFVRPASAPWYAALLSACMTATPEQLAAEASYKQNYWEHHKG